MQRIPMQMEHGNRQRMPREGIRKARSSHVKNSDFIMELKAIGWLYVEERSDLG